MLEKFDKASECSMGECVLEEAASLLRQVAGQRLPDESVKAVLRRVGNKLKGKRWTASRVRSVWYRDRRVSLRSEEVEELRAITRKREEEKANDYAELRATIQRLAKYEAILERIDAEFFGPQISATRDQLGEASRLLGTSGIQNRS